MRLPRRTRTDGLDDAARALARAHGDRPLAAATSRDGSRVLATDRALHVGDLRLEWDRVAKARWDADTAQLVVLGSPGADLPARRVVVALTGADRLLETVRVQVTASVVASTRVESDLHGGAWVTARRVPGTGEVRWAVVFDAGLDPTEPARRAWADDAVERLRRDLGV